ncbi:ribonuclease III domain-containing protein [Nemania sp. FL0916]|nr:ribonuclease III domain-containing protein [Nemania sp. FL0916]
MRQHVMRPVIGFRAGLGSKRPQKSIYRSPKATRGMNLSFVLTANGGLGKSLKFRIRASLPHGFTYAIYRDDVPQPLRLDTKKTTEGRATKISRAQGILNYKFRNEDLLWEALQAPGSDVVSLNGHMLRDGNKILASIGDAVVTLVVKADYYAMDYPNKNAVETMRQLVSNHRFVTICDEVGLTACINRNPSSKEAGARTRADTLEAVIGAVYQDGGMDSARSVMQTLGVTNYAEFDDAL